jgi:hypothetical protein
MNYNLRVYKNSKLVTEKTSLGKYCIRIDYSPRTIRHKPPGEVYIHTDNFSYVHTTSPSETKEEAMAKAEGYVDCLNQFYNSGQTYTDENNNSYTKKRDKELKEHRNYCYGQDVLPTWASSMNELIEVLEGAYKAGWDEKLSELRNDVGD